MDHPHRRQGLHPDQGNWFNNYFDPAVTAAFTHLWNDPDLQQAQVDAWTYLAEQLAGSPALLGYDLFNEPMWDLERLRRQRAPAMYGRVIAGIRTVDQRSWLWIEPTVLVGEGLPTACWTSTTRATAPTASATPRTPTPPLSRTAATSTSRAAGSRPTSR